MSERGGVSEFKAPFTSNISFWGVSAVVVFEENSARSCSINNVPFVAWYHPHPFA